MCTLESVEFDEILESEDIYPCVDPKCDKFHKSDGKIEALSNSIHYLKPNRVFELLELFDSIELMDSWLFKYCYTNLLHQVVNEVGSRSGNSKYKTIRQIDMYMLKRVPLTTEAKSYLEIVEIICKKFPSMINSSCYLYPISNEITPLLNILNKYYLTKPEEIPCVICGSGYPEQLIKKPCGLKHDHAEEPKPHMGLPSKMASLCDTTCSDKHVHLYCLVQQITVRSNKISQCPKCPDCNQSLQVYLCPQGRISFPNLNIWKQPLISGYCFIDPEDKFKQLELACAYLCEEKVKQILEDIPDEAFKSLIDNYKSIIEPGKYFIKIGKLIALSPNPITNLSNNFYPDKFGQINMILINKQIDCMDYSCDHNIKMSWGKYLWCGQTKSPTGSGFTLTNSPNTDSYGNPYTHAMSLELVLNEKLVRDCEFYDIYTHTGFLFGYNLNGLSQRMNVFKKISPDLIGTELSIVFSKKKKLTKEEQEIVYKRLIRTPREPVYTIKFVIPDIIQFGEKIDCNICLEQVDSDSNSNKYISPCGHLFHLNCIFEYLEKNDLVYPMYSGCARLCCGAKKIKPFDCVVCKTKIYK